MATSMIDMQIDSEESQTDKHSDNPTTPEEPQRNAQVSTAEDKSPARKKLRKSAAAAAPDSPNSATEREEESEGDSDDSTYSSCCSSDSEGASPPQMPRGLFVRKYSLDNVEEDDVATKQQQQQKVAVPKKQKELVKRGEHTHMATVIAAVVVIKDGKLLMMQEAKERKRGMWYIPAGRVEPGESPLDGAIREVKEETGLDLRPSGVFSIEFKPKKRRNWVRYGITGEIVGGDLKKWEDKESLDSEWVDLDKIRDRELRSTDFLRLVAAYLGESNNASSSSSSSSSSTLCKVGGPAAVIPMVYSLNPEHQEAYERERAEAKLLEEKLRTHQLQHNAGWVD